MSREFWAIIGGYITLGLGLGSLIIAQHASINSRLDSMSENITELKVSMGKVETRLDHVEWRLGRVDERLEISPPADRP